MAFFYARQSKKFENKKLKLNFIPVTIGFEEHIKRMQRARSKESIITS